MPAPRPVQARIRRQVQALAPRRVQVRILQVQVEQRQVQARIPLDGTQQLRRYRCNLRQRS